MRRSPVLVLLLGAAVTAVFVSGAAPARTSANDGVRVAVTGTAQAGRLLRATLRPAVRARFRWQRCEWTGYTCKTVAARATYRVDNSDIGRRLAARALVRGRWVRSPPTAIVVPRGDLVVTAAGDIACDPARARVGPTTCHQQATSDLALQTGATAILPLGDNQYECGRAGEFMRGYVPTWGRVRALSHPVIGNHEYGIECGVHDPTPYFRFFGRKAGARGKGWYSYDLGSWHLIALNSECRLGSGKWWFGGCGARSAQERWLRRDLARHRNRCTLAYWHEPRFSSSEVGDEQAMARIWNDLVRAHVDVVLNGHAHAYERFDPIGVTPAQRTIRQQPILNPNGIREFVVGTGGRDHHPFVVAPMTGEVVRNADAFGVITFTLRAGSYAWRFLPEPGNPFTDSGTASCH